MSPLNELLLIPSAEAAIVVALVFAVQRLLGDRLPAPWRHALWALVFLRLLLPVLPSSPFSLFQLAAVDPGAPALPGLSALVPAAPGSAPSSSPAFPWAAIFTTLWALGFAPCAAGKLRALHSLRSRLRRGRAVEDPRLQAAFEAARTSLGVSGPVRLLEVPGLCGPATCGILRPAVVVPPKFGRDLDDPALRHVFLHELSHVSRRDVLALQLADWLAAVHWFNPLIRWAARRSTGDGELACDAAVLRRLAPAERFDYGHTLLRLTTGRALPAPVLGISSKKDLERRISMISKFQPPTVLRSLLAGALLAGLAGLALTDALPAVAGEQGENDANRAEADSHRVAASVADLRTAGTAMYRWAQARKPIENTALESGNPGTFQWEDCPPISHDQLAALLVPEFVEALPKVDPWQGTYEFCLDVDLDGGYPAMGVRARGADGRFEGTAYAIGAFPATDAQRDIVWSDGYFVTWPSKSAS